MHVIHLVRRAEERRWEAKKVNFYLCHYNIGVLWPALWIFGKKDY